MAPWLALTVRIHKPIYTGLRGLRDPRRLGYGTRSSLFQTKVMFKWSDWLHQARRHIVLANLVVLAVDDSATRPNRVAMYVVSQSDTLYEGIHGVYGHKQCNTGVVDWQIAVYLKARISIDRTELSDF
jgi:hypothetical protein